VLAANTEEAAEFFILQSVARNRLPTRITIGPASA
jgi:hypothetical protein